MIMANFIRLIIFSLIVYLVFWSVGFTSELTLLTVLVSCIVFGYGLNLLWVLYRKFQLNNK